MSKRFFSAPKIELMPRDLQKIYDASLQLFKDTNHNALEPQLQMVNAVCVCLGRHLGVDIYVPERLPYNSVDDE